MKIKEIGKVFKEYRRKKHYTQKQVSDFVGILQGTYSKIENGNMQVTTDAFIKICCLLAIDMYEFIDDYSYDDDGYISPEDLDAMSEEEEDNEGWFR